MANKFHFNKKESQEKHMDFVPVKRNIPKWQWYFLSLLIASPLIYFLVKIFLEAVILTAPGFITFEQLSVRAPENGYVEKIYVSAGEQVEEGDALIDFHAPYVDKQIQQLQLERKMLMDLRDAIENQQLDLLRQMQRSSESRLTASRAHYKKFQELRRRGIISIIHENDALDDLREAEIQLEEIKRRIKASESEHRNLIESQYNEKIRRIDREITQMNYKKDFFKIKSQQQATVINIFTNEREYIKEGHLLMSLSTNENLHIRAFLDPKNVTNIEFENQVTIVLPDGQRIGGAILYTPRFSEKEHYQENLLKNEEQKVVLIIKPNEEIPKKYHIFGVPVKVIF